MSFMRRYGTLIAILFFSVVIYGPLFLAPSLSYDDDYNIFANPSISRGDWLTFWLKPYYGMYLPVTSTLWTGLYHLGGGEAWPFRILNFSLHLANTYLVYLILQFVFQTLKVKQDWILTFAVAIFAFHPLQVETVAWISGGRDLLSTFFCLLALLFFYQAKEGGSKNLIVSSLFFLISLLSKVSYVTMPVVVYLSYRLWGLPLNSGQKKALGFWLLLCLGAVGVTYFTQQEAIQFAVAWWQKPLVMLDSFGFYIWKFLLPLNLTVDYGRTPEFVLSSPERWLPFAASFTLFVLVLLRRRNGLPLLWILLMLPVSGLVTFAYQRISSVADHYCYFSMAILIVLTALLLSFLAERSHGFAGRGFALGIAVVLVVLSSFQSQAWVNDQVFFQRMLKFHPESYVAGIGLSGLYCANAAQAPEGLVLAERVLQTKPHDLLGLANRAFCLYALGRYAEIIEMEKELQFSEFKAQVDLHVIGSASFFATLGASFVRLEKLEKGLVYFCQAEFLYPTKSLYVQNRIFLQKFMQERGRPSDCPQVKSGKDFVDSIQNSNL